MFGNLRSKFEALVRLRKQSKGKPVSDKISEGAQDILRMIYARTKIGDPVRYHLRQSLPKMALFVGGQEFEIDARDNLPEFHMWYARTPNQPLSVITLEGLVRMRKTLFVDVGANIGYALLPMARAVPPGSTLIALEPHPVLAGRLKTNLALNGIETLVRTEELALSDRAGEAALTVPPKRLAEATLVPPTDLEGETLTVKTETLANVLGSTENPGVFILRLSTQGSEDRVLTPYVDAPGPAGLPDHILLDVSHKDRWATDVFGVLTDAAYRRVRDLEGNALFSRKKPEA